MIAIITLWLSLYRFIQWWPLSHYDCDYLGPFCLIPGTAAATAVPEVKGRGRLVLSGPSQAPVREPASGLQRLPGYHEGVQVSNVSTGYQPTHRVPANTPVTSQHTGYQSRHRAPANTPGTSQISIWLKPDLYLLYRIEDLITPHYWSCSSELCSLHIASWFRPIR